MQHFFTSLTYFYGCLQCFSQEWGLSFASFLSVFSQVGHFFLEVCVSFTKVCDFWLLSYTRLRHFFTNLWVFLHYLLIFCDFSSQFWYLFSLGFLLLCHFLTLVYHVFWVVCYFFYKFLNFCDFFYTSFWHFFTRVWDYFTSLSLFPQVRQIFLQVSFFFRLAFYYLLKVYDFLSFSQQNCFFLKIVCCFFSR